MSVRDIIPWGREESRVPNLFRDNERDPFLSLHREVNRLFDGVFRGFDGGLSVTLPKTAKAQSQAKRIMIKS